MGPYLSNFNQGRAAMAALLFFALCGLLPAAAPAQDPPAPQQAAPEQQAQTGLVVDSVSVRGNVRVGTPAIRQTAAIRAGSTVAAPQVQAAIRRLMATGNFATVDVLVRESAVQGRGTVVIQVTEQPFIGEVVITGLESGNARQVRDSVGLRSAAPLNPQRVKDAETLIRDQLARKGVQVLGVDTTLTPLPAPAQGYRLTLTVREGNRVALAEVDFRGNEAFSDDELTGAMRTRPEGFLWFRSGRFDREAFQADLRENLPDFYARNGYIDFAVLSDTLIVDPQSGKARLVVEVAEGPQYRLGEFTVVGNARFPAEELERLFTVQRRSVLGLPFGGQSEREAGEVFNRGALDAAASQIQQLYRNEGYLYAQVEPVVERVPAGLNGQPVVNATIAVSERRPFYIRKIAFEGNTTTHESVIRDRLWILPGDVYNEERVIQSYQAINGLGFFESPLPLPDISPDPDSGVVDITFHVKERQTGNINFGTVIGGGYGNRGGGVSGFLGYQQPNLFGQGKQASLRAEYGPGRSTFEASYTDPAIFGTRNSGSFSLFRTGDRFIRSTNGRRLRTGASLQFGFPVPGANRTRAFLGYSLSQTEYRAVEDNCQDSNNVFCLPNATASSLSLSLTRDTKNHPIFPTAGTRQSVSLEQTGGPLGGDGNFQRVLTEAQWWVPVGRLGGGPRPIRMALGLQARVGSVFGDVDRFPFERFFVGGVMVGQPLRGYQEYTIGPRGYDLECRALSLSCLGDSFLTVSGEYAIRVSDMLSVSAFADAGNVYGDVTAIDPTRLFRGAGVGATLVTPFLGAIGIDAAYGFDRPDPGWEIHFRFGGGGF